MQILRYGQILIDAERIRDIADVSADFLRRLHYPDAQDAHRARGRFQERRQHLDRRGLARAVGPDEAEDLSGRDGE